MYIPDVNKDVSIWTSPQEEGEHLTLEIFLKIHFKEQINLWQVLSVTSAHVPIPALTYPFSDHNPFPNPRHLIFSLPLIFQLSTGKFYCHEISGLSSHFIKTLLLAQDPYQLLPGSLVSLEHNSLMYLSIFSTSAIFSHFLSALTQALSALLCQAEIMEDAKVKGDF